jgi:uncharacterized protein YgiM (DUF1202 family)
VRLPWLAALSCLLLFATPPGQAADAGPARGDRITASAAAPLRVGPRDGARILGAVAEGEVLTVLRAQRDWTRVRTSRGKTGWVATIATAIAPVPPATGAIFAGEEPVVEAALHDEVVTDAIVTDPGASIPTPLLAEVVPVMASASVAEAPGEHALAWRPASSLSIPPIVSRATTWKTVVVREQPDDASAGLGEVSSGTSLVVLEEQSDWLRIQGHRGDGWVPTRDLVRVIAESN